MKFNPYQIYHVYNQGNNHQATFNCNDDYLIFLKEVRKCLLPHTEFIAYCLMPNHFHFLIYTDERCNEQIKQGGLVIDPITNGIRKLLSGYARIFNDRYDRSGSLFRQKTKSKSLCENADITRMNDDSSNACSNCFHYIHQNPFKAGLVSSLENWEFSSFKDYAGLRNGTLCNKKLAEVFCMYNIKEFIRISSGIIAENKIKYFC